MRPAVLSEIDFDVWVNVLLYYLRSLCVLALVALPIGAFLKMRVRRSRRASTFLVSVLISFAVGWLCYFLLTARWTLTRFSLDAEDSRVAELAYRDLFNVFSLDAALTLATDRNQLQNVRFYAACRAGDILANQNETARLSSLNKVKEASLIQPVFFGTNAINYDFFTPGFSYGPFSVRSVIEQRVQSLRAKR
jgi:predicted Kef-type K+ transport protein